MTALAAGVLIVEHTFEALIVLLFAMALPLVIGQPVFGAYFLAALIPFDLVWSSLAGNWFLKILGLGFLFLWVSKRLVIHRQLRITYSTELALFASLSVLALASGLWAVHLQQDYFSANVSNFSLLMWFLFTYNAIINRTQLMTLIKVFVFSATLSATIAIYSYMMGVGLLAGRAIGGASDPNELAVILVSAIPLALALASSAGATWKKLLYSCAVPLLSMAVLTTGSRGGFLLLMCAFPISMIIVRSWLGRGLLALSAAALLYSGWIFAGTLLLGRFQELSMFGGSFGVQRFDLWKLAWKSIQDRFLLGAGLGSFRYLVPQMQSSDATLSATLYGTQVAHNTYLSVWAELGSIGLLLFGSIIALSLYRLYRSVVFENQMKRGQSKWYTLCLAILFGFLLCLFGASMLNMERSKLMWLFVMCASILWKSYSENIKISRLG
ncbi:MAG: O-antigen ligase family protein [Caldilineaceae bacterium]